MYALNENQQAIESRQQIRDALLSLMAEMPYQEVSITQICKRANVVRQTYYRNFEFKADILTFHLDGMFKLFFERHFIGTDIHTQLKSFFDFMLQNREFLLLTAKNELFFMFNRTITDNIAKFLDLRAVAHADDPRAERYVTGFIAATVTSLLTLWAEHGFEESPAWMAELAGRLLSGLQLTARQA